MSGGDLVMYFALGFACTFGLLAVADEVALSLL